MCSSTRGPAIAPSFVTWPTKMTTMPRCLASRVSCAAHSRTCATLPGAEVSASVYAVWIESMTTTSGFSAPIGRDDRLELHFGEQRHRRVDEPEPLRAQRDLLDRFLAGDVERRLRGADRRHRLQQQRRLADARIAAEQDHAARDEPAAQHAVELLDAGRKARRLAWRRRCASGAPAPVLPATLWKRVGAGVAIVSTSVFHAPQCGHWPCHFGLWPPHSVQL